MDEMYIGLASVLLIFGVIPVTAITLYFKMRTRQMDTLMKLVEHGASVDAETIKLMSGASSSYKSDYRWGLLLLALGIPVTIGIWASSSLTEAVWGLIPVFFGLAFLIAGAMRLREPDKKSA